MWLWFWVLFLSSFLGEIVEMHPRWDFVNPHKFFQTCSPLLQFLNYFLWRKCMGIILMRKLYKCAANLTECLTRWQVKGVSSWTWSNAFLGRRRSSRQFCRHCKNYLQDKFCTCSRKFWICNWIPLLESSLVDWNEKVEYEK